jgi:hypothetical protein
VSFKGSSAFQRNISLPSLSRKKINAIKEPGVAGGKRSEALMKNPA